jgi:hypothetical protein
VNIERNNTARLVESCNHRQQPASITNEMEGYAVEVSECCTGVAIASTAAAIFLAGCSSTDSSQHFDNPAYAKVKCYAANACKSQSECKTSMSSCEGHNTCKGQSFVLLEERACIEKLGRA